MRNQTTKRVWMAAVALMLVGAVGACADEPMAVEDSYEVQMSEDTTGGNTCIYIDGQLHCDG